MLLHDGAAAAACLPFCLLAAAAPLRAGHDACSRLANSLRQVHKVGAFQGEEPTIGLDYEGHVFQMFRNTDRCAGCLHRFALPVACMSSSCRCRSSPSARRNP